MFSKIFPKIHTEGYKFIVIAAFITKGLISIRLKWYFRHKIWVKIMPRDAYTYLEYRFKNDKGKTIKL